VNLALHLERETIPPTCEVRSAVRNKQVVACSRWLDRREGGAVAEQVVLGGQVSSTPRRTSVALMKTVTGWRQPVTVFIKATEVLLGVDET